MLRLSFIAPDAPIDLSRKFGAPQQDAHEYLWTWQTTLAFALMVFVFMLDHRLRLPIRMQMLLGVCLDLCEQIKDAGLPEILRIDIGGGFPAHYIGESPDHPCVLRAYSQCV